MLNLAGRKDIVVKYYTHLAIGCICPFFLFTNLNQLFGKNSASLLIACLCCVFYLHLLYNKIMEFWFRILFLAFIPASFLPSPILFCLCQSLSLFSSAVYLYPAFALHEQRNNVRFRFFIWSEYILEFWKSKGNGQFLPFMVGFLAKKSIV